jgi:SET domain-containing protein
MPEVAVRDSLTGGLGVFTLEALVAGQFVREFKLEREITADSPLRPEQGELPEYCPLINGRFCLVASPDRYLNHSCHPNVYLRFGPHSIDVVALRDVEEDSELTIDYLINNPGGDSWPCRCGAARCRGETGKSFFTLPESFQREYLRLLAPWFRERYQRELKHLA